MAHSSDRDQRARAHYGNLLGRRALPESLGDDELSSDRILTAAASVIPSPDARFCREVRTIAAFLGSALTEGPPSEKDSKEELEQVRDSMAKLQERLVHLSDYTRRSLGELIPIHVAKVDPPALEEDSTPSNPEDQEILVTGPELELDDRVGQFLVQLSALQERLHARLAERAAGGRPRSAKWYALLLLCNLVHEYKGSCTKEELTALAEAYFRPVLALRNDYSGLRDHVDSVIKEADQIHPKTG